MADIFSRQVRSRIMARIPGKNTKPELAVRKELSKRGYRFKTHAKLPGSPDIVFPRQKVVVFIDGDFWHGWKFKEREGSLPAYWRKKIANNMRRDRRQRSLLRRLGWRVLRVWEHNAIQTVGCPVERIVALLKDKPVKRLGRTGFAQKPLSLHNKCRKSP
ncbi:MAG: very short patch repair endonuclease [Candidatus Micrarchaeota archaeon]|nr:very short patch repair endonuclease [Candidatus Micrarchaeota archaeon]